MSAPTPTSARPSSARIGPIASDLPLIGRPRIAVTVATSAAMPQSVTPV